MTKPTVLLVDDDRELRELLREQLEATGDYAVVGLGNAAEALSALSAQAIDVVVTDLRMPGTSGTKLCKEVVRLFPDVPVLLMTAFGSLDSAIDAIRAGAADFIVKPFMPEQVQETLQRWFEAATA